MDELLKNKEFKSKMASLSPGVKQWFIEALVDLFEQESEYVIDVLEDCRFELGRTADAYIGEAEHLRAASRMLEERRDDNGRSGADRRRPSEALLSPLIAPSRLSFVDGDDDDDNIDARRRRRRERSARRRMPVADQADSEGRSPSVLSVPSHRGANVERLRTPSPGSARGMRSLSVTPRPPDEKAIQEETKAILQTMTDADAHVERERERQQERLERIRRQKKFLAQDRTAQAMKLLEKALEMDRVLAQDKQRQGKMLQDKLQDLKKRRQNIQSTHSPVPDVET